MPSPVASGESADFSQSAHDAAVAAALKRCVGDLNTPEDPAMRQRVLDALDAIRTTPPEDLRKLIGLDKYPVFECDPADPEGIIQVQADGTRTAGRVVSRKFDPNP